ncbi:MAG: TerB family tellurite resistance protein, partial [Hyphomicrobiaceae bacterium]
MLESIESFLNDLFDGGDRVALDDDQVRIASAALLVHCARSDGRQSASEEGRLRTILSSHFALSDAEADQVVTTAAAQERDAVDIHRFTRVLHQRLDRVGRQQMIGWLWEVAQADGSIGPDEHRMVSLAAQLLDVETRDSVALRQAAVRGA